MADSLEPNATTTGLEPSTEPDKELIPPLSPDPDALQTTAGGDDADEPYVSPFDGREDDEVLKDPVVARILESREQRIREEADRAREAAANEAREAALVTTYRQATSQAAQQVEQQIGIRLQGIKKALADGAHLDPATGAEIIDPNGLPRSTNWFQALQRDVANAAFLHEQSQRQQFHTMELAERYPGYRPDASTVAALERAYASGDPRRIAKAEQDSHHAAVREYALAEAKREWEAESAKKAKDNAELARQQQLDADRKAKPRVTQAATKGGQKFDLSTRMGLTAAAAAGEITDEDFRRRWTNIDNAA